MQSASINWCQIKADMTWSRWDPCQPSGRYVAMALGGLGGFPHSSLLKRSAQVSIAGGPGAHISRETRPRRASGLAWWVLGSPCMSPSPTSTIKFSHPTRVPIPRGHRHSVEVVFLFCTDNQRWSRGNAEARRSGLRCMGVPA